jgi:hypothetical protein
MLRTLARGLGVAARSGAAPLVIGARVASWRRIALGEGIPTRRGGIAAGVKMALDELFLATELAAAPLVSPRERTRMARELSRALGLFERSGWLENPASYHEDPPPLEIERVQEGRSGRLPVRHLTFESGYAPREREPGRQRWLAYRANRTAHARLFTHPGRRRPWLVCIPGYRMGHPTVDLLGFRVRWLYRQLGVNVAIPMMPLHGPRRSGRRSGDGFFTGDFIDTVHAQAQAVWDVRRLIHWLRDNGAPRVGVYGVSLGAYTAALTASLEEELDCVIAGIPATCFVRLFGSQLPEIAVRALARVGLPLERIERLLSVVSPLCIPPRVPRERRFLYAGLADQLATPEHARDLWHHWERPRSEWYDGSHVSFLWESPVRALVHEALTASGMVRGTV